MKTLILVPSLLEMKHLLPANARENKCRELRVWGGARTTWGVCGIGPAAATLSALHLMLTEQPDRLILLGIAGSYPDSEYEPGRIVQVSSECFADLGHVQDNEWHNLDKTGLPMLPTSSGALGCEYALELLDTHFPAARSLTVSTVTNSHERAHALQRDFSGDLENMEGAGVPVVDLKQSLNAIQVGHVSIGVHRKPVVFVKIDVAVFVELLRVQVGVFVVPNIVLHDVGLVGHKIFRTDIGYT